MKTIIITIQCDNERIDSHHASTRGIIGCQGQRNETGCKIISTSRIRSHHCIGICEGTTTISCPDSAAGRTSEAGTEQNDPIAVTVCDSLVSASTYRCRLRKGDDHLIAHRITRPGGITARKCERNHAGCDIGSAGHISSRYRIGTGKSTRAAGRPATGANTAANAAG